MRILTGLVAEQLLGIVSSRTANEVTLGDYSVASLRRGVIWGTHGCIAADRAEIVFPMIHVPAWST
ncbi:MAG: hypothetical protein ACKOCN_04035, partial [Planctomycetaceae bacterium]